MIESDSWEAVGQRVKDQVVQSLTNYKALFESSGLSWDECKALCVKHCSVEEAIERDMKDFARGAGLQDWHDVLVLNCRTEVRAMASAAARRRKLEEGNNSECTTVWHGGSGILAQTWDWRIEQSDAIFALDWKGSNNKYRFVTLTEGGILSKMGMNSQGLAVTLNLLTSKKDGFVEEKFVPVHVVLYQALSHCSTVTEAVNLCRKTRFGASSCLTFADATGVCRAVEVHPDGILVLEPDGISGLLSHSNHFIGDFSLQIPHAEVENSQFRHAKALELLAGLNKNDGVTAEAMRALLANHSTDPSLPTHCLCKHANTIGTLACLVFDTKNRTCSILPKKPCTGEDFLVFYMQ